MNKFFLKILISPYFYIYWDFDESFFYSPLDIKVAQLFTWEIHFLSVGRIWAIQNCSLENCGCFYNSTYFKISCNCVHTYDWQKIIWYT